ncbi:hypothetical protein F4802DRAFT_575702 [Xylaria palmicola]|nr:hypothetical protein F4802DRAFT_575702 [Xylaria palmicola]
MAMAEEAGNSFKAAKQVPEQVRIIPTSPNHESHQQGSAGSALPHWWDDVMVCVSYLLARWPFGVMRSCGHGNQGVIPSIRTCQGSPSHANEHANDRAAGEKNERTHIVCIDVRGRRDGRTQWRKETTSSHFGFALYGWLPKDLTLVARFRRVRAFVDSAVLAQGKKPMQMRLQAHISIPIITGTSSVGSRYWTVMLRWRE